jgi:hypothetical protein
VFNLGKKLAQQESELLNLQSRLDELEAHFSMFKKFAMETSTTPVVSEKPLPANLQAKLKEHIARQTTTEKVILGYKIRTSFLEKS